ncbi:hypothetical protein TIFTF001_019225 [Ficus carica]|uniref:Glutaredoxin domain-containing protein n=1 Tax=Ficus carica TaxID=3494 RepID=A0AA88A8N7_FICCA|nr:hypothetical protein TIFTF001_019225 [Ficus carica]
MMARSLSNILFKGISGLPAARSGRIVSGSFYQYGMRYSSTPNEPDTHDDFKPTNKLESSGLSLKDVVEQDVKENPVMIYMKGVPDLPQCGFSSLAVRVLKHYDVPLSARNILENPELKSAVKAFSTKAMSHLDDEQLLVLILLLLDVRVQWPTFPQIFIKGEFIGGSDIILNLHQTGELKEKLEGIAANLESSK